MDQALGRKLWVNLPPESKEQIICLSHYGAETNLEARAIWNHKEMSWTYQSNELQHVEPFLLKFAGDKPKAGVPRHIRRAPDVSDYDDLRPHFK